MQEMAQLRPSQGKGKDSKLAVYKSGFVFDAPHARAARRTARTGAWLFGAVRRSYEFGELGSLRLSIDDR